MEIWIKPHSKQTNQSGKHLQKTQPRKKRASVMDGGQGQGITKTKYPKEKYEHGTMCKNPG